MVMLYQGERENRNFLAISTLERAQNWDGDIPVINIYELQEDGTYDFKMQFYYDDDDYPNMTRDEANRAAITPYFTVTHSVIA